MLQKIHESITDKTASISTKQINTLINAGYIPKELGEHFLDFVNKIDKERTTGRLFIEKDVKQLVEEKYISEKAGSKFLEDFKFTEEIEKAWKRFNKDNPEINQNFSSLLTLIKPKRTRKDLLKVVEFLQLFESRKELLDPKVITELSSPFYKTLKEDEFGISRIIADPINRVPKMLKEFNQPTEITKEEGFNVYMIESRCENDAGDTLLMTHRFRSINKEEAEKRAAAFVNRINGRQKKVWEACWAMATQKESHRFLCFLTELMHIAYPNRKGTIFSTKEKIEFYHDLLDLEETKIKIIKNDNLGKKKKRGENVEFIFSFITILSEEGTNINKKLYERYPQKLTITVLDNPLFRKEKLFSVGAGIKYSTLKLHANDVQLAEYIQIRSNQRKNSKTITCDRDYIMELAGLQGTKHKGTQNRLLLAKLKKYKQEGIIKDYPQKILDTIKIIT